VAGYTFEMAIPIEALEQFLRVNYTLAGTTPLLTITAQVQPHNMVSRFTPYQDALTIS
jgi:hypothetical protein